MNPEDKVLLERTLKLSEENNRILQKLDRKAKWAILWGFIKILIVVLPLVAGYIFLQPFLDQSMTEYSSTFDSIKELINQ